MEDGTDDAKREAGKIGGARRAEVLPPTRRSEIAREAAAARWRIPQATHPGILTIANSEIPCYVLENGERVLSTRGIMKSLRRTWRGRKYAGTELPVFLEANNLKAYLPRDLGPVLSPKVFRTDKGAIAEGFSAEILPVVCETYLAAREADELTAPQLVVAKQCELLARGLARVGIIALVDEATGYQEVRDRMALQAILDAYLRKELAAWAKRFPDEFYRQIFRLRNWEWKGMKVNRPQVVAYYTNDFVWERLAPGILDELKNRMPKDDKGRNKGRYPQLLTDDVGHPALAQHIYAVTALMTASRSWDDFKRMINAALPKKGTNLEFDFGASGGKDAAN